VANPAESLPNDARAERRAQLLGIARRRFVKDGFAGTSVSAIVREAGVAQGTFYLYFESKQAVLGELRREVFRTYATSLAEAARAPGSADARLVDVVVAMARSVGRHLPLEQVFRQAASAHELETAALEGRARLAGMAAELLQREDALEVGDSDPRVVAELLVTLFDTVLYEAWAYQRPAPVSETVRASLRLVLGGLGVEDGRLRELLARVPDALHEEAE
jgi:AcrR family transcriptional regulator